MQKVNIIMPVHNRWDLTKQSLDSLLKNTSLNLVKITIVDDNSDPENIEKLMDYEEKHHAQLEVYYNKLNIGPGASRNFICNALERRGEAKQYLYHTDNDVYFKEGWLEKLLEAYNHVNYLSGGKVKVLGASCHPYLQNNGSDPVGEGYRIGFKDAVSGYSQLMEWTTWKKYGPFDETMRNAEKKIMGSEDWAFCQKIVKDGFLVGSIEPELVIPTGKHNTYGDLATGYETFKDYDDVLVL